jgi:two-component system chemotaxis sensor kinase CheA
MNIDRELVLQTFRAEASEHLDGLESELLALEQRPDDREVVSSLFRHAHTLKGNALVVGFGGLVASAHVLEDALDRLREGRLAPTARFVSLLLQTVDGLRRMVDRALAGNENPDPAHGPLETWLQSAQTDGVGDALPAAVTATATKATVANRSLRVTTDKLDKMLDLVGEMTVARGRLETLLERGASTAVIRDTYRDSDHLFLALQEMVMRMRMVPLEPIFRQFRRTVRDLALSRNKQVDLVSEGSGVELDTEAIEAIRDPLIHIIRNAVDHGIEPPEVRERLGKPPVGSIALRAGYEDGRVFIKVHDDGAGLSRERIRNRARRMGLLQEGADPDESQLADLIFQPGFSTAETVTEVSGRGVGMDVVRKSIDAIRGSVSVKSREGLGTTVTLRVPLTLAIIQGFAAGVEDETFIIPLEHVVECLELPARCQLHQDGRGVLDLRGDALPILRLRETLGMKGTLPRRQNVLVLKNGLGRAGLVVDCLHGERATVIKPLAHALKRATLVAGTAVLPSGKVALIVDVPRLFQTMPKAPRRPADPIETRRES